MDMEYLDGFLKQEPEAPIVYESIPMALNRSNQSMNSVSASSVWSNNTLASSNTMSSYSSTNDPPIYQSYNSGYPEILGSESFTDNAVHYQTLTSNYHGRQTPSSLGWTTSAPVKEYYDLVCEKNKEPCLRIRMDVEPEYPETFVKPPTVYFDRDESVFLSHLLSTTLTIIQIWYYRQKVSSLPLPSQKLLEGRQASCICKNS